MLKFLPNLISLFNLFFGCVAIVFAIQGDLPLAAGFVVLGIFFDFFDGLAARAFNAQSELGKQLDSLADVVTSGLAPGVVMMQLLFLSVQDTVSESLWEGLSLDITHNAFLPLFGLLITLASAYRLAKFNIDERQTDSFIGLPTPANTLWIISLPLILIYQPSEITTQLLLNPWVLMGLTLLSAYLLNANIRLFSLKFKTRSFKGNSLRYVFLIASLVMLSAFWFAAVPLVILFYILLSLFAKNKEAVNDF